MPSYLFIIRNNVIPKIMPNISPIKIFNGVKISMVVKTKSIAGMKNTKKPSIPNLKDMPSAIKNNIKKSPITTGFPKTWSNNVHNKISI